VISGKATQPSTDKMGHFHITLIFMIRKIVIKIAQKAHKSSVNPIKILQYIKRKLMSRSAFLEMMEI
jgi:hypothetical protein